MISFVIPVYNEQDSIISLTREIEAVCNPPAGGEKLGRYEIIIVSDGSTDRTNEYIRKLRKKNTKIRGVLVPQNRGKASALHTGFSYARGDRIVTMDGDGQDDPREVGKLLRKLEDGYDMVSGWKQDRQDPFVKTISSRWFNSVTRILTRVPIHDANCGYKAYRADVAKSLTLYGQLHRFIPALLSARGYRIAEVRVKHRARKHGVTKYGPMRFFHGYFDLVTTLVLTRFRSRPLHLFGYIGFLFFFTGFLGGAYLTGLKVLYGAHIGQRPLLLLSIMLMLMGVQIGVTGLIGEYITYVIRHEQSSDRASDITYIG